MAVFISIDEVESVRENGDRNSRSRGTDVAERGALGREELTTRREVVFSFCSVGLTTHAFAYRSWSWVAYFETPGQSTRQR